MSSYYHGDSLVGRIMLPTKLQALKLHFFLKDEARRKNSTVTPGEITGKVVEVIKHYWVLAGYETAASPKNKIAKLLKDYQFQHKNNKAIYMPTVAKANHEIIRQYTRTVLIFLIG